MEVRLLLPRLARPVRLPGGDADDRGLIRGYLFLRALPRPVRVVHRALSWLRVLKGTDLWTCTAIVVNDGYWQRVRLFQITW